MLAFRELGFQNLLFIVFFLFGSIASFVIRWKWNKSVERKKEILRRVAMASEEAARVEREAEAEYYASSSASAYVSEFVSAASSSPSESVSVARQSHQCAVCFCPTTTRCARCKAVRYCSGKCQIIHWRQGHKDECYPPNNTFQFNGPEGDTDKKTVLRGDQNEVYAKGLEIKESCKAKPIETYTDEPSKSNPSSYKDDDKFGQPPVISDSVSTSSLVGCSATTANDPLSNASDSELHGLRTTEGLEEPLPNDIAQYGSKKKADVNGTKLTKSPSVGYSTSDLSTDNISHRESTSSSSSSSDVLDSSKIPELSIPNSDFWEGALNSNGFGNSIHNDSTKSSSSDGGDGNLADKSRLRFSDNLSQQDVPYSQSHRSKPKTLLSDDAVPIILRNKSSSGVTPSEKTVTDISMVKSSPTMRSVKPISVDNVSSDSQVLGDTGARSLSPSAYGDNTNSGSREQPVSNVKSSSVRKVVQQFKVYKISKHYATGFGCDSAEKYKMVFPYELFVKFYHWDKVELRPCGLTNIGNSCYANAVLQCLAFTRPLTAYLLQGFHSKSCPKKGLCFMCEFEGLILKAKDGKSPLSPAGVLSQLQSIGNRLGHGREEDAHEFLRYLIDMMQSLCLKEAGEIAAGSLSEETTLIGLIFGGYLRSKIKCTKCHGKSERRERMMDLTVEINGDIRTLEEALAQFTATEILDGQNKYECLRCRSYEKAKKKMTILEAPNVLTIALKRFRSGECGKLKKPVQFPEFLNLVPYMSGTSDRSPIYRLYAVVVHRDTMSAAFSGHYVSYVRSIQGKWFSVDDSIVKPVELEKVLSEEAYMLLYARRSPRPPCLIRKTVSSCNGKIKDESRCSKTVSSINGGTITSRSKTSSTVPSAGLSYPYWTSVDPPASSETYDSFDRIHKVESSSDNSSLLSCSDAGSCSTESTWDSASTDDFPDYIFGNSPLRVSEDSYRFSPLAASERHVLGFPETSGFQSQDGVGSSKYEDKGRRREGWQDNGSLPILHPNTSKDSSKLTDSSNSNSISSNHNSSSNRRDTDSERLDCNSLDVNSQRRYRRERRGETFY